ATGYWRQPELTAARFGDEANRMYRTGDKVRRRADGSLEYLGRLDQQVKLRGHRVELGEIEAQLCTYPGVALAAVVARESELADLELIAYFTMTDPTQIGADRLREYLAQRLPAAMVPATYVPLT